MGPRENGERTSYSLAMVYATSAADTGARQDLGYCRKGSRVGVGPKRS